jgi:peptidoglycan/LPS O-acetylase OafA/YrhL
LFEEDGFEPASHYRGHSPLSLFLHQPRSVPRGVRLLQRRPGASDQGGSPRPIPMTDQRVHEIDGLRALAMLLVTAQHCGLAPIDWTGVWLFFVVSGFVIARNFEHGAYQGDTRRARWLDFMRRRFWRIVPVYVLYVAFVLALLWSLGRTRDLHMAAGLLTFTYNWQTIFAAPPEL